MSCILSIEEVLCTMQLSMVRVRIAPSPTGIPHIGNTRTALFNYLFAKHSNGVFILRIEDTDQARKVEGAEEAIEKILNWLGLIPDEKYVQSERLNLYKEKAEELLMKGLAKKEDGAVRFIIPKEKEVIEWIDAVGSKKISFSSADIEDFIILKSDGFPTYHLASVVDDYDMQISHVIRGEEWISSTPKHILLYEAFGWKHSVFVHLPVILGPDKTKLSKRHGAKSALDYRDEGYLKEPLLNYMALLGWNPGGDKEIMSLEEMVKLFNLKDINTANPIFDAKKLEWMNGIYIRKAQNSKLKTQSLAFDLRLKPIDESLLDRLLPLAQTRGKTLKEIVEMILTVVKPQKISNENQDIKKQIKEDLEAIADWNKDTIAKVLIQKYVYGKIVSLKDMYMMLFGVEKGLPLSEAFEALGKEKTLALFQT